MASRRYKGRHRAPTTMSPAARRTAITVVLAAGATGAGVALPGAAAHAAAPTVDWGPIIACESGGNPTAHNPSSTASGLFQFLTSSWLGYGGGRYAPTAAQATPAEQTAVAEEAFRQSGLTPWAASRSCWAGKVDTSAPSHVAPAPPAPKAAPKPSWQAAAGAYTVRAGDTLSGIAAAHGRSWRQVWQANRATIPNPNVIYPGEHITL